MFLALTVGLPATAFAQVLEIGDGGTVTVFDRPAVFTGAGAMPIERPRGRPLNHAHWHRQGSARLAGGAPPAVDEAANAAAVGVDLINAVAWQESRMRPGVVSPAGAIGEMQLMPATARGLGIDPFDPRQNLLGGAVYLGGLLRRYKGDTIRALAAYNAGPGAVDRYGGVPPFKETRDYVDAVLSRLSFQAVTLGPGSENEKR